MEQILCPNCGEPIASLPKIKGIIGFCKEFWDQCSCGQRYQFKLSDPNTVVLSFPDRQLEIVC